jgi:hypothetical protein
MNIVSKARVKHLIKQGHKTSRFDRGKYKWTGTMRDYFGKEVPSLPGVVAVFPDQRKDKDGPYVALVAVLEKEAQP